MPSFSSSSSIRVASQEHVLRLNITHNLVHGSPSDYVHSVKGRLPKELDVLWLSDIAISLSGSLDAHQTPAHDITRSGLAHHLHAQLKMNADRLGVNNVSRPFVDDADGLSKLTLTPSRPLPHPSRPHANLVSLHLAYIWRTVSRRSDIDNSGHLVEEAGPFSPTLFLPAEALLNRVTEQFLIYHVVGRYPLIFGPWCKRLDLEMQYFPSVGHSIVEIMTRSENHGFLSKCRRLLKIARSQHKFVLQASVAALSSCTDDDTFETPEEEVDDLPATPVLTDEQILCASLEQLFRVGVPQRRFKPAATPKLVSFSQDDDDSLLQSIPDEKMDDEVSWVELPEIATTPCALPADYCQTLPEDMDIFAKEIWFEGGMWRLHEADASPVDGMLAPSEWIMCEAQSDESLIDASISLASITTRSPQACSFTLYHHQDVDYHELDPAASGSRDNGCQLVHLEESGTSALFANLTHSPPYTPHDHCFSDEHEQLMQDSESFDPLDSCSEGEEVEDSDSILFELDVGGAGQLPDGTDAHLDWLA